MKLKLPRRRKPERRSIVQLEGGLVAINGTGRIPLRLLIDGIPEIKHVIEHKPRPRPTVIQPVIMNQHGEEWRTLPINCDGRYSVPVYFPLSWLSGNPADADKQAGMRLDLHYEPR